MSSIFLFSVYFPLLVSSLSLQHELYSGVLFPLHLSRLTEFLSRLVLTMDCTFFFFLTAVFPLHALFFHRILGLLALASHLWCVTAAVCRLNSCAQLPGRKQCDSFGTSQVQKGKKRFYFPLMIDQPFSVFFVYTF